MKVPKFIEAEGGNNDNWYSSHDDLFLIHGKPVHQKNQLKFWKVNVIIRKHLSEIRMRVVNSSYELDASFPKLTFSNFSKISGVSRKVLYDRKDWLEKEIHLINKLIGKRSHGIDKTDYKSTIDELNLRIELLRRNSGEDFIKIKKLEDRIFDLNRALEIKSQKVNFLSEEVDRLSKIVFGKDDNQRHLGE